MVGFGSLCDTVGVVLRLLAVGAVHFCVGCLLGEVKGGRDGWMWVWTSDWSVFCCDVADVGWGGGGFRGDVGSLDSWY